MEIVFKDTFLARLERQLNYIAYDSISSAKKFKRDLFKKIRSLKSNPYKCRRSIYFDDEQVRDLVFKGYTVVYRIHQNTIEVFGFVKYQNSPTD